MPICNRLILTAVLGSLVLAISGPGASAQYNAGQDTGDLTDGSAQGPSGMAGLQRSRFGRFGALGASRQPRQDTSAESSPDVKIQKDVAYGSLPKQNMDIYIPAKLSRPAPILMFVHGGGWEIGDKKQHGDKGFTYPKNGIILVSVNYRLAPDAMHPKQVEDVAAAFAWLKKHAAELGGNPDKMYIMGHSAGAHLVDLLGTNERFLKEQGLSLKDVKGVISLDTASLELNDRLAEGSTEAKLVGPMILKAFGSDPKVLTDGSPLDAIHSGQTYPPFLMFCGSQRLTCVAQHKKFSQALKQVGGTVTVKSVPLSHREINLEAGRSDTDMFKEILAMIR